jgi:dTDP-6-deoxy-L-talose 4-dehydrogenase (NAD+)
LKILVTGANGYLGQGIVKRLLDDGVEVIATDICTNNIDDRALTKKCNLFTINDPYHYFGNPEVLLHLAWDNGFIHNAPSHIIELSKHYSFLKTMIDSGISRVAVMGSMHEIGFYEGSISESTPANPMSLYGVGKNALRNITQILCLEKRIPYQWLRGFYIVGNSEFGSSIFSKITAAEKSGEERFPFTSGQNQCDFLDYSIFCEQVAATVEQGTICGIINICSGKPEKLADRVERFIIENHYKIKLDYCRFPDRLYDSKAIWGDDSNIRKIMQGRSNYEE